MHRFRRRFSLRVLVLLISCLATEAKAFDEEKAKRLIKNTFDSYLVSKPEDRLKFFSRKSLLAMFEFSYVISDPNMKLKGLSKAYDAANQIDMYEVTNYGIVLEPQPIVKLHALGIRTGNKYLLIYSFILDHESEYRIDGLTIEREY